MTTFYLLPISEAFKGITPEYAKQLFPRRYEKATRYKIREDYLRCISVGVILHDFLCIKEQDIEFEPDGKPVFSEENYKGPLRSLSITHSGDFGAVAVSDKSKNIGIDIEIHDEKHMKIASKVFAEDEQEYVNAADSTERFFKIWTIKEALLKAEGSGLLCIDEKFSVMPLVHGDSLLYKGRHYKASTYELENYSIAIAEEID